MLIVTQKPPLCKGRCPEGAEGLPETNRNNPSVGHSAASSPYTGEPLSAFHIRKHEVELGFLFCGLAVGVGKGYTDEKDAAAGLAAAEGEGA